MLRNSERVSSAEKALGPQVVHRLMDGMSYSQAKVFLEKFPAAPPPPSGRRDMLRMPPGERNGSG
jgi:hypothetical protein